MLHIPVTGRQSDTIRGTIYRRLYFSNDQHTRQSLARDCGISMPTLYQNLSDLMEAIPYPVYAANDESCSGYAEWLVQGDGTDNAYLSLENGESVSSVLQGLKDEYKELLHYLVIRRYNTVMVGEMFGQTERNNSAVSHRPVEQTCDCMGFLFAYFRVTNDEQHDVDR